VEETFSLLYLRDHFSHAKKKKGILDGWGGKEKRHAGAGHRMERRDAERRTPSSLERYSGRKEPDPSKKEKGQVHARTRSTF